MNVQEQPGIHGKWASILFAVIFISTLGVRPLFDPDEGRYAEIPREMVVDGHWFIPHLNYVRYLEKPPLGYWLTAVSLKIFGLNEWAARLPNALCYLATGFMIFAVGRKFLGEAASKMAAWIYATSLLPLLMGRFVTLDFGLTFFLSAGLFLMALAENGRAKLGTAILGWGLVGLATLVKGPIALVLTGGTLTSYWILRRMIGGDSSRTSCPLFWHVLGAGIALAVSLPWFYEAGRRVDGFWKFFIVQQHIQRFQGVEHARPFWYYLPAVLIGVFPWTGLLFKLAAPSRWLSSLRDPFQLFCWCWFGVTFAVFSAAGGKMVTYILPLFAPLALLMAAALGHPVLRGTWTSCPAAARTPESERGSIALAVTAFFVLAGIFAFAPVPPRFQEAIKWMRWPLCTILSLGAAMTFWSAWQKKPEAIHMPAGALLVMVLFLEIGGTDPDIHRTAFPFRRYLQDSEVPIVCYGDYFQSVNFYSGRRVILANNKGELAFGSGFEDAQGWFWDEAQMDDFISSGKPAMAVMKLTTFREKFQGNPKIHILDQAASLVLVSINGKPS